MLNEAQDINSGGDIVGAGAFGGVSHAFLVERFEGLDTMTPVAMGSVSVVNGSPASQVTVNFWDNEKVVGATTHAFGSIHITGPNGYDALGTVQSYFAADRQASTTTLTFIPPGGSWNGADNGMYEIRLAPGVVSDLAANVHPGGVIGTFVVGIQTTPTLTISGLPTTTTLGAAVNLTIAATGSYPAAAGDVFAVAIDWDGDGGALQTVNAPTNTAIPHTFTTLGTHTVRVTVTDPHALASSERTVQIVVTNAALPIIGEAVATPGGAFTGYTTGVAAVEGNGVFYLFGGYVFSANDSSIAKTWDYTTPGADMVDRGNFDNGPVVLEGAGVDGRGRIVVYGGFEQLGAATASVHTFTIAGGAGEGAAAKPGVQYGATARDNLARLYSISSGVMYRYDAGASGNGAWSTLAAPDVAPTCAAYDGAGHIIAFSGTTVKSYDIAAGTWATLANAPTAFSKAALGADGLLYCLSGTGVYIFTPATATASILGTTASNHTGAPLVLGNNGYLYLLGNSDIERIDTRPATTRTPRITSAPTGITTLSIGTPWTYQIAASGKAAPTFSILSGPVGMSVGASAGLVAWTPTTAGTFTARVRATNSAGTAEQMIALTVLGVPPDTTPPTPPTNIAAFNITTTSADLQWSAGTDNIGVVAYRLKLRHGGGTRWHPTTTYGTFGTTTGLTWHVTAGVGATITYYLVSVDAAGNESSRAPFTVSFVAPPTISANASGTFGGTRAIVSEPWTGNVFTASGNPAPTLSAGTFPAGALWYSLTASSGYFTWTAIAGQEGTQTFTVNATNTGGSASFSNTVTVYPAGTDLIPPSGVSAFNVDQVSFDSCRVTWAAATDNYSIASYLVAAVHREARRRFHRGPYDDHVVSFDVPVGTTQANIPGLRPSTSYIVSVTARDTAGLWGYSATRDIRTLLQPFVLAAAQTTTTTANGSTTMTWTSYGYYWKYTVQYSDNLATWAPVEPANQWPNFTTTFTFTPDPNIPARFYRVLATPAQ